MFKQFLLFMAYSITVLFATMVIIVLTMNDQNYVTGKYALYCYEKGYEHANIKHKLYFDSLEECGKPLKNI